MEPTTFVLWRDALDLNYFTIGVKFVGCPSGTVRYFGSGQVHIDGIFDAFGSALHEECKRAKPGVPIEVTVQIQKITQ